LKMDAVLMIGGVDARRKGLAVAEAILIRTRRLFQERGYGDYRDVHIETLGAEASYGPNGRMDNSREILLRIAVTHSDKRALALLAKEITPSALAMAPGITGSGAGRPKFSPYLLYRSCLIQKSAVPLTVHVGDEERVFPSKYNGSSIDPVVAPTGEREEEDLDLPTLKPETSFVTVPLIRLCHGRSGDKGDCANIGIICRHPFFYPIIAQELTEEKVHNYLPHLIQGQVRRYSLPGIYAFNFVCTRSLGGGGLESLRMDRQGKCHAQQLLECPITIPRSLLYLAKC